MPSPYHPTRTIDRRVQPSRVITLRLPPQTFTQSLTASLSFVGNFAKGLLYLRNFGATLFGGWNFATGLVSYWKLDETSGTRFDSFGTNHLTDNNTVNSVAGIQGNAAQFTKVRNEYLSCASNSSLQMSGNTDFTIAAWIRATSNNDQSFVTKDDDAANSRDYTLDHTFASGFRFYIKGGATYLATSGTITIGVWYFVVAWYDSSVGNVYLRLNDSAQTNGSTAGATGTDVSAAEFRIGAREYLANEDYAQANIDEVAIWKRLLTPAEITALYNSGAGTTYGAKLATLTRLPNKSLTATLASTAALVKRIMDAGFTATLSFVGAITRRGTQFLTATKSFIGNLAASKTFVRALTATLTFTGAIKRTTGKVLTATLSFSAALSRRTGKALSAGLSFVGTFVKNFIPGGTLYLRSFTATLFSGAPPAPDLIDEGFEGTGTPSNWFQGGSANFDYSAAPLSGSQSLRCDSATSDYSVYLSGGTLNHGEIWFKFLFKVTTMPSTFTQFVLLQDGGFNDLVQALVLSSGALQVKDVGGIFETTTDVMSSGTLYSVWGHYKKGSGTNAVGEISFDVAGNPRPNSGTKFAGAATGWNTTNAERFGLLLASNGVVYLADNLQVSSTDIFGGAGGGPSATLSVRANKALTATLSFIGAFAKTFIAGSHLFTQALTATLTSTAALTRRTSHGLTATLAFIGAATKRSTRFLTGTLSFIGTFAKSKAIQQALSATLSFVGAISARIIATRAFTATLSFTGASARRANKAFAATLSFVGALVKRITDAGFSATLSFVGALTKRATRAFSATLSFIGNLAQTFIHGGTAFTQSLTASLSFIGTMSARGIITRAFTATLNATAILSRSTGKLLAATLSSNASLLKRISRTFSAVVSSSAALVKFIRDAGFTATLSFVGNLTSLVAHFFTRAFTATLSFSATITRFRLVQRVLTATLAFSGAFQRRIGKSLTATLSFSTAIRRNVRKVLRGTLSFIGFIFKGGAVTVLAGWVTKCLATIGLAGRTANSTRAGSQLTVEKLDESGMKIQTTGSTLTVERTK